MDRRKKKLMLIAGAGIGAVGALALYASPEPESEGRQRPKSVEEERIEGLVDLMETNGMAVIESTAPPAAPPINVPLPETEAFDIGASVTRHRRSAEAADGAAYYDCDGDCAGQGVGITMDGSAAPMPGDELGSAERPPERAVPGMAPGSADLSLDPRADPQL